MMLTQTQIAGLNYLCSRFATTLTNGKPLLQHVCEFEMGLTNPDPEETVGAGTIKECMSDNDVAYFNEFDAQFFEFFSIGLLNAINLEMRSDSLDCVVVLNELIRLQRTNSYPGFYKDALQFFNSRAASKADKLRDMQETNYCN